MADRLHVLALHLLRRLREEDDALGLSPPRVAALTAVVEDGPMPIGALAADQGVSAPTMSRLVDGLERDGLVRREPDPDDARGVRVRATPRGARTLERSRRRRTRALAERLGDLEPEELGAVARGVELIERVARG
ncbi:MAG: MarR family transcriptional regulator [Actinomycetota bacterium]|nr:MAG: MarR family transcriptional regulator [Actinomycetota bacterium]